MYYGKAWLSVLSGLAICLLSDRPLLAQETTTYGYDPLARLTASSIAGGSNNGVQTATCFDSAGNRSQYQTGTSGLQACPTPTPSSDPGPPTPPPSPPAAPTVAAYSGSKLCNLAKTYNIVASDTDPGGNLPITVISVQGTSNVMASVASSTSITVTGFEPGTDTVLYVVANSKGATSAGIFTETTTGTQQLCNQ